MDSSNGEHLQVGKGGKAPAAPPLKTHWPSTSVSDKSRLVFLVVRGSLVLGSERDLSGGAAGALPPFPTCECSAVEEST